MADERKRHPVYNSLTKIKKELVSCGNRFVIVSEPVLISGDGSAVDPDEFSFELNITREELLSMISVDSVLPGTVFRNEHGELFEAIYYRDDPENCVTLNPL